MIDLRRLELTIIVGFALVSTVPLLVVVLAVQVPKPMPSFVWESFMIILSI
jgi:hypothetical protein